MPSEPTILTALQSLAKAREFHPILLLVCEALEKAGYGKTRILGRRTFSQKSLVKGAEILVEGTYAGKPHLMVVKFVNDDVRQRNFDELFGVTERLGANLGILVSLRDSHEGFMKAPAYRLRLKLLDGTRLAEFLTDHQVGVFPSGHPNHRRIYEVRETARKIDSILEALQNP